MTALQGTIALVAGATRGAGRGIAVALGEAGATVYCSGRSSRSGRARAPHDASPNDSGPSSLSGRPETIEETAELVSDAGGDGRSACCDHSEPAQVAALVARIRDEQGRLDVLVNNIWGGDALTQWSVPFWEQEHETTFRLWDRALRTHVITARAAVPLMLETGGRLLVEITDGERLHYRDNFAYDIAKTTVIRMGFAMAEDLRPKGMAAVVVTPGFLRSEVMLEHFGVSESNWRDGAEEDPHFAFSESPRYVGRSVAALAADPDVLSKSGRVFSSWRLMREYGFTDLDGRQPDWGRHAAESEFGEIERASHARFVESFSFDD